MAEAIARRSVAVGATPWLHLLPAAARFIFRGDTDAQTAAGAVLGVALASDACRAGTNGARSTLWLGPDEYLLIVPEGEAQTIAADLARALGDLPHSLVDVSHRQVALELRGPQAEWLLEAQCPLPLHVAAFPVGQCARTVFGKAEILLWRTGAETFRVEVTRSFTGYVVDLLGEIARELEG